MKIEMNERRGEFLVGLALALRGTSLLFGKIAMRTMGPFLLMGTRSLIAFALMAILFRKSLKKIDRSAIIHSMLVGLLLFLAMAFELKGLQTTDSSVTAFLEGSVVIFVPFFTCIIARKLPDKMTVISSLIALAGVGFLTLKGGHFGFTTGELLVIGGTIWYSLSVLVTDTAAKNDDPMAIAILQLFWMAFFSVIGAFIFEDIRLPQSGTEWAAILALAIVCSCIGFTLQPFGQKYTTPERAGLMAVFNPLSAAALGIIFLGERMTWSILFGSVLIIIAIVLPAWIQDRKSRQQQS